MRRDVRARRRNETRRPRNRQILLIPPALIFVIERVFRAAGIQFPRIVPDTPDRPALRRARTTGKRSENQSTVPRVMRKIFGIRNVRIDRADTPETASGNGTGEQRVKFYRRCTIWVPLSFIHEFFEQFFTMKLTTSQLKGKKYSKNYFQSIN